MSDTKVNSTSLPANLWEAYSPKASRDLLLKKIAVVVVAALNFAIIALASYYAVSYIQFASEQVQTIWICSPFILGVLAALAYMKVPGFATLSQTCGSNPVQFMGKMFTYLFFGPLVYVTKQLDFTPYHQPTEANKIGDALRKWSFDKIADKYGKNFDNLIKYGFIDEEHREELNDLYKTYLVAKETRDHHQKNESEKSQAEAKVAQGEIDEINQRWVELKKGMRYPFPVVEVEKPDFSKKSTKLLLAFRQFFDSPINTLQGRSIPDGTLTLEAEPS